MILLRKQNDRKPHRYTAARGIGVVKNKEGIMKKKYTMTTTSSMLSL